ncbi:TolC family protein [Clostridium sp. Marseille-P2415]|uniref:TolC family protein n=1 Tax=Clostridium sp. Marseille-P2415 TaxID=1805471 RepID=UPI0009886F3C|nr:TolC family protein [Clostridium sp. Marseille-P2415]
MRKWKQISACCLAAVLTVSGPAATAWAGSPEFARTQEEWAKLKDNVMEYDELSGLIHEYNVTVQKNQLDINDKKKDDRITSDDYAQKYRDAASDYRSSISGDDPASDAQNAVSAATADEQADKNVEDLTVYQLTYDQEEANLVATAQSSIISYFQQTYELESAEDSLVLQQAVYQSTLAKQSAGMATQADVLTAQESIQNSQTSIEKLRGSIEETRQKLCIMLGWKYNDAPEIKDIPAVDMDRIASMNPETDKETALQNNYTLKINKRKLENAAADITKNTLKRTISSNEQNINKELVKSYQAVLQAKASYEQATAEYDLESKNMDTAERKHQIGMMSQLDYQNQKNAYNTKSIAVKTAELTLFQAVQTYDNAVNGLASAGG